MHILIIDSFPENFLNRVRAIPQATVDYQPDLARPEVLARISLADALVINSKVNVDWELLEAAPHLKMVCRAGVGLDHFDLGELKKRGIRVMYTPGANAVPVGEQTVGMLLALFHRIVRANAQVKEFEWRREENRGMEIMGKTVGIIGFGNTGSRTAACLSGFGCRILAYDKYKSGFGNGQVQEVDMETIYAESDVVSLHIPLTDETRGWVGAAFFARFAKPIWLLNLARGPIVPLDGLIAALDSGRVLGAGLDVLENEKLHLLSQEERFRLENLFARDNVIVTPHIGGWSNESLERINAWIAQDLEALAAELTQN